MPSCCVRSCISRTQRMEPGITFHKIPSDESRRAIWLHAIDRLDWMPPNSAAICSLHFDESCFISKQKYTVLSKDAYPTKELNLIDKTLQLKKEYTTLELKLTHKVTQLQKKVHTLLRQKRQLKDLAKDRLRRLNIVKCQNYRFCKKLQRLKRIAHCVKNERYPLLNKIARMVDKQGLKL